MYKTSTEDFCLHHYFVIKSENLHNFFEFVAKLITRLQQKPLKYTVTYVFAAGFSKFLETARKNLWLQYSLAGFLYSSLAVPGLY